jgi:hypothetical protein
MNNDCNWAINQRLACKNAAAKFGEEEQEATDE